jgi:hypothetical protein
MEIKIKGHTYRSEAEVKGRVAALDLEYEGELMPEEARPLLHLSGVPWAQIGEHVGQRSLRVTADTYSHVLVDERELDYAAMFT